MILDFFIAQLLLSYLGRPKQTPNRDGLYNGLSPLHAKSVCSMIRKKGSQLDVTQSFCHMDTWLPAACISARKNVTD